MIITVRNYRGLRAADDVEVAPIALVAGRNRSGKSSLCEATAAAVTGTPLPLKIAKKDAQLLVGDGAKCGAVTICRDENGNDMVSVRWPAAEVVSEGKPISATAVACGLVKVLDLDTEERAALLIDLLGARPTKDDLAAALTLRDIDPHAAEGETSLLHILWASIEQIGWDDTYAQTAENATKRKGAWEQVTRRRYGSKVAASWRPDGWDAELETTDEEPLQAAIKQAEGERNRLISQSAASDAELDQARRRLSQANETARKQDEGKIALAEAEAALHRAQEEHDALPEVGGDSGMPCPHCGALVRVIRGIGEDAGCYFLEPGAESVDRDEYDRRHKAKEAAKKRVAEARTRLNGVRRGLAKVEAAIEEAATLRSTVERLEGQADGSDDHALQAADAALEEARARLKRWTARREADTLARTIAAMTAAKGVLAPTGLRRQKLAERLDPFNVTLRELALAAEWPIPWLTPEMDVLVLNRPQVLWSESEVYRTEVLLRLATAALDGSDLVIIDAADILDAQGRNGLASVLTMAGRPALVTATYNEPRFVPDLEAAGLGRSYWIEDGVARPLIRVEAAAAE